MKTLDREGALVVREFSDGPLATLAASDWIDVRGVWSIEVAVYLSAITGSSTPTLSVWLQASADDYISEPNPANWDAFDYPPDYRLESSPTGPDVSPTTDKRNIMNAEDTAPGVWRAVYRGIPANFVRVRWGASGSFSGGQGATFRVIMRAK